MKNTKARGVKVGKILHFSLFTLVFLFASCIENDIPYPLVESGITAFEVENMCDDNGTVGAGLVSARIDKAAKTVTLNVDDRADLSKLRITRLLVSNDARIELPDSTLAHNYAKFPRKGFASLADLYVSSDTRVNFTKPVAFCLSTYQQYKWTVSVNQIVKRNVLIDGQVGDAIIDDVNHNVVVYVTADKDLKALRVSEFTLGGLHGKVLPDPTATETYDFSGTTTFYVQQANEEVSTVWRVFVYHTAAEQSAAKATVFPMSVCAHINGTVSAGQSVSIEYKKQGAASWTALNAADIKKEGTRFSAVIPHLTPSTNYLYRLITAPVGADIVSARPGDEQPFTTAPAPQLTDGSFDNWHKEGKLWNPWAQGGSSFWDTGNRGATTVGDSNTVPTDETCDGKGQAALLESKYIVVKFAAGNIFTGQYVQTDGTNGVLDFGRPFNGGFPTALRINYKYKTSTINRSADTAFEYLKGRPDSCQFYIALADRDEPFRIRTRPSQRQLLDPKDPSIIAYAQLTVGDDVPQWKQQDIPLVYYPEQFGRTPNYIVVVASASKYGDYFTGGEGTKLWLDNLSLVYE